MAALRPHHELPSWNLSELHDDHGLHQLPAGRRLFHRTIRSPLLLRHERRQRWLGRRVLFGPLRLLRPKPDQSPPNTRNHREETGQSKEHYP